MTAPVISPVLGLDREFPDTLYVLHHVPSGKYGCYHHKGVNGLASFESEAAAANFSQWIDLTGMAVETVSFEEARQIAKDRPLPIVALMLLDDIEDPMIHYVR
jgi:hypothetical protein